MYTDSIFKICLIVSVSAHLCLVLPWPFLSFLLKPDMPSQKIETVYFNENKIAHAAIIDIKPQSMPKPSVSSEIKSGSDSAAKASGSHDTPKPVLTKKEEQKPIQEVSVKKEEIPKSTARRTEEKRNEVEIIDLGTQKGIAYEKYFLDVREKIRSIIEKNKRTFLKESEVCVRFILDRNGMLRDLYLYKSSGTDAGSLERLAVKSIKEAAPFPPFTGKIKEGELQFNLPIRVIRKD
ncbi:MAG: TonB C-terminal domain-containing protein [Candidatus Omnitrophica bacterium]|nr:TonB C-terminal domain-containing protein [Candidatus Omnitrophota bacterium]